MEGLWELILSEEDGEGELLRPVMENVGDILDYLLFSTSGAPISDRQSGELASKPYRQ